jgi:hypothetical protein
MYWFSAPCIEEEALMRATRFLGLTTLGALTMTMAIGCGEQEVQVAESPNAKAVEAGKPVPKAVTKGGGPSSSGNMKRNPGADPLKKF